VAGVPEPPNDLDGKLPGLLRVGKWFGHGRPDS
jgi:hypothetical protein